MKDKDGIPYRLVKIPIYEPVAWHNLYEHINQGTKSAKSALRSKK